MRGKEREGGNQKERASTCKFIPPKNYSSWGWARAEAGSGDSIHIPRWVAGTQLSEPSLLPPRGYINGELESGAAVGN